MQNDVIECVAFRARDAAADAQLAEAAWAAQPEIECQPGFVSRQFGRHAGGGWIDLIRWNSAEAAYAAARSVAQIPEVARFFELIDSASVQMQHYTAPAPAALWSSHPPARQAMLSIVLADFTACRAFYEQHFNARALFDMPAYVLLQLGGPLAPQLALMKPRPDTNDIPFAGGAVLNLQVDDVDALYARLVALGVPLCMALEDHGWGDRGFAVRDPAGLKVYCYRPQPAGAEFAGAFRAPWRLDLPTASELEIAEPA